MPGDPREGSPPLGSLRTEAFTIFARSCTGQLLPQGPVPVRAPRRALECDTRFMRAEGRPHAFHLLSLPQSDPEEDSSDCHSPSSRGSRATHSASRTRGYPVL